VLGRSRALLRRLRADIAGSTMVEFAMALPVMLAVYVGGFELSMAISCSRNVAAATHTLTDLASQCSGITSTGDATNACWINNIFGATAVIMQPFNSANANMRLTEVQIINGTQMQVVWSAVQNGSSNYAYTALTAGSKLTIPTTLTTANAGALFPNSVSGGLAPQGIFLLIGEVTMPYSPAVTYNNMTAFKFSEQIYMAPRLSSSVTYS
jgi:Flp pilus assembly protein TadG